MDQFPSQFVDLVISPILFFAALTKEKEKKTWMRKTAFARSSSDHPSSESAIVTLSD